MQLPAPPSTTGQVSPDGMYRWDGARWVPTSVQAVGRAAILPPASGAASSVSWMVIAGAAASIVGGVLVIAGCIVPYASFSDGNGGTSYQSIFNAGFSGGLWYAVEPVAVAFLATAGAVVAIVWSNRIVRAVLGGSLVAFGIQTLTLFAGYTGAAPSLGHMEPGGPIGTAGGLVLFVGGLVVTAGALTQRSRRAT